MESDFYAKEKDLILNNEVNTMKKIEDDFGDKDKLAEQMFLAHHKYLNIPILGPLFYFKLVRWIVTLLLLSPINQICGNLLVGLLFPSGPYSYYESAVNPSNIVFILGYLVPFILIIFLFIKFKATKRIIILSALFSLLIIYLVITLFLTYTEPTRFDLIVLGLLAVPYILLIFFTLLIKKILKK